ncbi:MAG: response regulator [Deltaproteobacteria bacterium]|nr:response regulator [Deltaproteobacteria bacterium]MBW2296818.1 response regulator [Deltaproteobacteria bacterium]MBW2611598.1 response regulator [Deltaproteobacteria bacterium]MBW2633321.1 response regulator [Deltaproteobacteria bacterium]MBW2677449.1 response regulator [Deltaproteobacteria bacterium]
MKKKILIVDDNRLLRKFLSTHLERAGHHVRTAEDGFAALDVLSDFAPDVMFVDLFMPKIDGDRLCQIVRARDDLKDCYLVILSAGIAETGKDYTKIGANACIAKGSFSNMAKNVLAAVNDSDAPVQADKPGPIIGLDAVYSRQLTKELISRNRHLETILESMAEGFLEIYSDRVVYANEAAVLMLEMDLENLLYAYPPDLFEGKAKRRLEKLIAGHENIARDKNAPVDLHNRKVTIKSYPVEGEPSTSIIIFSDVTEQKRLEEKLQQAKKMEAVGTLAGGVAHDFNNLLMGVQGNISLMMLDLKPGDSHFEEVASIERCVDSAAKLTKQLLGFARGGKYVVKATSLNEMIRKLKTMFQRTNKNISFHEKYQNNPWSVEVDQGQIEQVMMNLLLNACQAMPQNGELSIQTENVTLNRSFVKSFDVGPGRYVKISVTDSGCGMDPAVQQRIFEPFFTTKNVGEGSGMGLASAFGIVKNHRGIIECRSIKGKGSTFSVYLPVSHHETPAIEEPTKTLQRGMETILLVDDEDIIISVDTKLLEELGYKVLVAKEGTVALEIFTARHHEIDLVLLDIIMPDLNGEEVFAQMKRIKPDVKVLVSSGYSIDWQARKMLEDGCNGFIQKPFKMKQLSLQIKEILSS